MTRRRSNAALLMSLVLCAATLVLWYRSYDHPTAFHRQRSSYWAEIVSKSGRVYCLTISGIVVQRETKPLDNWAVADRPRKLPDDWATDYFDDGGFFQFPGDGRLITSETSLLRIAERRLRYHSAFLGITAGHGAVLGRFNLRLLSIPYRLILVVCAFPLVIPLRQWVIRQRDFVRRCRHQCPTCGYNLHTSKD